jgi:hypothetical protein
VRRLVFAALALAMTVAALLLGLRREYPAETPAPTAAPPHRRAPDVTPRPATTSLRRAARGFARAFLAFEAGGADRAARATIRRGAGHRLAHELLAHRPPRSDHPGASIVALHVALLPHRPGLALLIGTARRTDGPEPFAFLFARRGGRWLAVAPAE